MSLEQKERLKTWFLLSVVLVGVLFPFNAHGQAGLFSLIGNYLVTIVLYLVLGISYWFLFLSTVVLQWVTSPNFISWNYTGAAGGNPLVSTGWQLARDLVNSFFVIYIAFIGLATALRFKEYEAKKLLPKILVVALLINFTPVICGIVIDASNILMNFFMGKFAGWDVLMRRASQEKVTAWEGGGEGFLSGLNPVHRLEGNVVMVALSAFNIIAGLIYFLFGFLFGARYLALWIAVITSPIAFAGMAVPFLSGFWKSWQKEFFNWCFIGVTGGFYLYLANLFLVNVDQMVGPAGPETSGLTSILINFLQFVIPYGLAVAFISFGLIQTLKGGAMFSDKVVAGAKWTGSQMGQFAKKQYLSRAVTSKWGQEQLTKIAGGEGRFISSERWENLSQKGRLGKVVSRVGKSAETALLTGPFSLQRAASQALKYGSTERQKIESRAEELEDRFENLSLPQALTMAITETNGLRGQLNWDETVAWFEAFRRAQGGKGLEMWQNKDPEGFQKVAEAVLTHHPNLIRMAAITLPSLLDPENKKISPALAKKIQGLLLPKGENDETYLKLREIGIETGRAIILAAMKKGIKKLKDKDIEKLAASTVEDSTFQEALLRFGDSDHIKKVAERGGKVFDSIVEKMNEIGAEQLMETNSAFVRQTLYSPAYAFFGNIRGAESKEKYKKLAALRRLASGNSKLEQYIKARKRIDEIETMVQELKDKSGEYQEEQKELDAVKKELAGIRKEIEIGAEEGLAEKLKQIDALLK